MLSVWTDPKFFLFGNKLKQQKSIISTCKASQKTKEFPKKIHEPFPKQALVFKCL